LSEKTNILIVFSSETEAYGLYKKLSDNNVEVKERRFFGIGNALFEIFISGIGIFAATYSVTKKICSGKYDLLINAGICGSYNEDLYIGDTVSVVLDEFADTGVTFADNSFKTLFEEGLLNPDASPFSSGKLYNRFKSNVDTELPKVTAITVNNVSGSPEQIKLRKEKFDPDIETMEGAAVAYVALRNNIKFLQIRTVSNKAEPRNKNNWDIPLALNNLSEELLRIINKISLSE